jgi:hypothetical protein
VILQKEENAPPASMGLRGCKKGEYDLTKSNNKKGLTENNLSALWLKKNYY